MRLAVALAKNSFDRNTSHEQRIADQRTVESKPGMGTVFTVKLSLADTKTSMRAAATAA
jgi:hypothetical protein